MKFYGGIFLILTILNFNHASTKTTYQEEQHELSDLELFLIRLFDLDESFLTQKPRVRPGIVNIAHPQQQQQKQDYTTAEINPNYMRLFRRDKLRREKLRLEREREDYIYRTHLATRISSSFKNDFHTMRY